LPASATWMHNREQGPPPVEDPGPAASRRRPAPVVGHRTELARYTVAEGERILYGQRIDGIVRFLPEQPVVVDASLGGSEDSGCSSRDGLDEDQRPKVARQERPIRDGEPAGAIDGATVRGGRTGVRVELARYRVSAGERVLYGQRVCGVVRVTDVPAGHGRAYLVERELEQNGYSALNALIADYLGQARRLDAVPMAESPV
jgi:hypothetical protein